MKRYVAACVVLAAVMLAGCADNTPSTSIVVPPVVTEPTSADTEPTTPESTEKPQETDDTAPSSSETEETSVPASSETQATDEPVDVPASSETDESTAPETPSEPVDVTYDRAFFTNDLFIGDSIATGLYLYNKLDMQNVAAAVGYTPYKAYTDPIDLYDGSSMTAVDYAVLRQPKRIYVMIGSNGLAAASAMEISYRTMIDKLRENCPESEIYCISLTPVTADTDYISLSNEAIMGFNAFIEGLCSEYGLSYVDFYTKVVDDSGYFSKSYAEIDGFHFKGGTYDLLLNTVQKIASSD